MIRRLTGLLAAAHPGPALVVTLVVVGLGVAADLAVDRLVLLAVAILLGQVSIGWSNDWIDGRIGRDRGRDDKPVSTGAVALGDVRAAAWLAAVGTVVASLGLGVRAGALHLLAVASGWAYNAWLKSTAASGLPYVLSFGLLPVIVSVMGRDDLPRGAVALTTGGSGLAEVGVLGAPWWAILTAACFGAGVHLANALPDLEVDARTGVLGLPQRIGYGASVAGTVLLLGVGAAVVLVAPAGAPLDAGTVVGGLLVTGLLAGIALAGRRGRPDLAFKVAMLTGLVVVGLLVARGDVLA